MKITPEPRREVLAIGEWKNNAELIAHGIVPLGYLTEEMVTLDPTYGLGNFWTLWQPRTLVASDLDPEKSPSGEGVDFTDPTCYDDSSFDAVVVDGPYRLNGTPSGGEAHANMDASYGTDKYTRWQDRMSLLDDMLVQAARVCKKGGTVLFKCQDQVVSGKVRWQTIWFADAANDLKLELIDQLHLVGYRPQPPGRKQIHARRNYSTMMVFKKL